MKFVCPVCGYVYEGDAAPEKCPQCGVPGSKFTVIDDNSSSWFSLTEHKIGVGRLEGVPEEIVEVCALTSPASAQRSACTLQWQEPLTARDIPR